MHLRAGILGYSLICLAVWVARRLLRQLKIMISHFLGERHQALFSQRSRTIFLEAALRPPRISLEEVLQQSQHRTTHFQRLLDPSLTSEELQSRQLQLRLPIHLRTLAEAGITMTQSFQATIRSALATQNRTA